MPKVKTPEKPPHPYGLYIEVSSYDPSESSPYQVDPLAWKDPARYIQRLRDAADRGITDFILHRPFGEVSPKGTAMYYDTYRYADEGDDDAYAEYVRGMRYEILSFMQDYPKARVTIYIGSMDHPDLAALETTDTHEWWRRIWHPIRLFVDGSIRFAFDAISTHHRPQQWAAYCMIERWLGRDLVMMEAVPKQPGQRGTPCLVLEADWQKIIARTGDETYDRSMLGKVTRVLTGHTKHWDGVVGVPKESAFIADCQREGHTPFVSYSPRMDHARVRQGVDAIREQISKLDKEGRK